MNKVTMAAIIVVAAAAAAWLAIPREPSPVHPVPTGAARSDTTGANEGARGELAANVRTATGATGRTGGVAPSGGDPAADPSSAGRQGQPVPTLLGQARPPIGSDPSTAGAGDPAANTPPKKRYPVTAEGIREAIGTAVPQIRECYESWVKLQPSLRGRLVLAFQIGPEKKDPKRGVISKTSVVSTDIKHEVLEGCVMNAVEEVEFEDPPEDGVEVKYPFVFDSGDGGS